jgi:hypothetical protein
MGLLLDIFGFLSVVLRGAALARPTAFLMAGAVLPRYREA